MNCKDCFHRDTCGWTDRTPLECNWYKPKDLIFVLPPEGYEFTGRVTIDTINNCQTEVHWKKKSKSSEESANELRYKIGDKVWRDKEYIGVIESFNICGVHSSYITAGGNEKGGWTIRLNYLTNKAAIHCPTKEEFEFISKLIHPDFKFHCDWEYISINHPGKSLDNFTQGNPFDLILTVEEYCKAVGIELPILFYTEDFKDGSFPVKSCNNCIKSTDRIGFVTCNKYVSNNCICWQGEFKGEPIRKGDKCWLVCRTEENVNCSYSDWTEIENPTFFKNYTKWKFFSNETNAKLYEKELEKEICKEVTISKEVKDEVVEILKEFNCIRAEKLLLINSLIDKLR